ncbi:hypothetical protein LZC95_19555 [Pendulispora brunnea]|uniref:HTH HARE-type domain-containing protein n=1 Tax=Pendulispora brunnea TaxID=2905690 RepID=A0ABZ2KLS2_9BACT
MAPVHLNPALKDFSFDEIRDELIARRRAAIAKWEKEVEVLQGLMDAETDGPTATGALNGQGSVRATAVSAEPKRKPVVSPRGKEERPKPLPTEMTTNELVCDVLRGSDGLRVAELHVALEKRGWTTRAKNPRALLNTTLYLLKRDNKVTLDDDGRYHLVG